MSRFVRVQLAPKYLQEGECVIHQPDFYQEIAACDSKRPRSGLLTPNYLREIVAVIGNKYVGEDFDAMRAVNVSQFRGVPCSSNVDLNKLLIKLFYEQYPQMMRLAVEYQLKSRPSGTKLIYFTGDSHLATVFVDNGLDEVLFEDLEEKKPVGKPAITDEEAAAIKNHTPDPNFTAEDLEKAVAKKREQKKHSKKNTDEPVV